MKRTLSFVLALLLALSLAACGGNGAAPSGGSSAPPIESSAPPVPPSEAGEPETSGQPDATPSTDTPQPDNSAAGAVSDQDPVEQPPKEQADIAALWEKLSGCWTAAEEHFAYFTYQEGGPAFWSGLWEQPIPYRREAASASSLVDLGDGLYTLSLTYPPVSGDAADNQDLKPLRYTLALDISGLEQDGKIRIEAPDDQWRQYAWGGASYDDTYDSVHDIQYATFAEVQSLWSELTGYWNSEDGRFVVFEQEGGDALLFQEGVWDAGGGRGFGTFEKAMTPLDANPLKFIIYYPAIGEENLADGPLPELSQPVYLDRTKLDTTEALGVKIGEDGAWNWYQYAGADADGTDRPMW